MLPQRSIYSLCEAHFENFRDRCLTYEGKPEDKETECRNTHNFLAECLSVVTSSCCEEDSARWHSACNDVEGLARDPLQLAACGDATRRLVGCTRGTFGIKERIELQSADDRELEHKIMAQEAENERLEDLKREARQAKSRAAGGVNPSGA